MDEHREELLALFSEVDPWRLRDILRGIDEDGLPDDEYSPEVDRLAGYEHPTAEDVLRVFVEMGTTGTSQPGEKVGFGSYPAISEQDAALLAEGIAHIRGQDRPGASQ